MACELAMVEGCNNAVLYCEEAGRSKPIVMHAITDDNTLELRIEDHTPGFTLPLQSRLPEHESESGRGIFLMRSIMDDVSYEKAAAGNTLILKKYGSGAVLPDNYSSEPTLEAYKDRLAENEQIIHDMTEELSSCYESLSAIFRCGTDLGKTDDLAEFARCLCSDLLQITSSDWFVLRVVPKEEERLIVFTASEPSLKLDSLSLENVPEQGSHAEVSAALSRQDVWFDPKLSKTNQGAWQEIKPSSIGLVHPFYFGGKLVGTLTVGKEMGRSSFTAAHANVIHTFADFLAIQIVNARFREEQMSHRLTSHELEIAKNIQRALLPKQLPVLPGLGLAAHCESARQVGGDFYTVIHQDGNCVLAIIADVMGKGIPAAMFAAIFRSALRATTELNSPRAIMTRINTMLFDELSDVGMFITAEVLKINMTERTLSAATAGHCPVLIMSPGQTSLTTVAPDGLPLGILPNTTFEEATLPFPAGSRVLLYTDGVTDAQNATNDFFGQNRLFNWMEKNALSFNSAEELKESLVLELNKFQDGGTLYDDQTFIVLMDENKKL